MKIKIISVLGTRPEIIKFSPLLPLLDATGAHALIHTGQHYDPLLDSALFRELRLKRPRHNIGVGSCPAPAQIGRMMEKLGALFTRYRPEAVIVLGDTNSTLAGALAAVKCGAKVVHLEAGCRSFRASNPEEQNRVLVDHVASLHVAADRAAAANLLREGIAGAKISGSTALEAVARAKKFLAGRKPLCAGPYALATLHRAENTASKEALEEAFHKLALVAKLMPVAFAVHPRTQAAMKRWRLALPEGVRGLPPLSYLTFLSAMQNAECVLTDSGGIQEEAALLGVPCIVLREESEWMSYIREGRNFLAGSESALKKALKQLPAARRLGRTKPVKVPPASQKMVSFLRKAGLL